MRLAALGSLVALLVLSGCGDESNGEKKINNAKLEPQIKRTVESITGARGVVISCPQRVKAHTEGFHFRCQARAGDHTRAVIRVVHRAGQPQGKLSYSAPLLHTNNAVTLFASSLARRAGSRWKVDCPDLIAGSIGRRFACAARAEDGRTATVLAKLTGPNGQLSFRVRLNSSR